jgi:hypothetical protein
MKVMIYVADGQHILQDIADENDSTKTNALAKNMLLNIIRLL